MVKFLAPDSPSPKLGIYERLFEKKEAENV